MGKYWRNYCAEMTGASKAEGRVECHACGEL